MALTHYRAHCNISQVNPGADQPAKHTPRLVLSGPLVPEYTRPHPGRTQGNSQRLKSSLCNPSRAWGGGDMGDGVGGGGGSGLHSPENKLLAPVSLNGFHKGMHTWNLTPAEFQRSLSTGAGLPQTLVLPNGGPGLEWWPRDPSLCTAWPVWWTSARGCRQRDFTHNASKQETRICSYYCRHPHRADGEIS